MLPAEKSSLVTMGAAGSEPEVRKRALPEQTLWSPGQDHVVLVLLHLGVQESFARCRCEGTDSRVSGDQIAALSSRVR